MKKTDYAPRAADFDTYIRASYKTGIEIGVDVGAHAEAMLTYCSNIEKLYLADVWQREYYKGYCEGRLFAKGFMNKVECLHMDSKNAYYHFLGLLGMLGTGGGQCPTIFDFIYIDQLHDYNSVSLDLHMWWNLLNIGGIFGYRNYADSNEELKMAVDEFIAKVGCEFRVERGEIILLKDTKAPIPLIPKS